jgi:hypothetical protein
LKQVAGAVEQRQVRKRSEESLPTKGVIVFRNLEFIFSAHYIWNSLSFTLCFYLSKRTPPLGA